MVRNKCRKQVLKTISRDSYGNGNKAGRGSQARLRKDPFAFHECQDQTKGKMTNGNYRNNWIQHSGGRVSKAGWRRVKYYHD